MKAWLVLCFIPAVALAEPRIETIDRGTAVEVIARDTTAAKMSLVPVRSRLEIAVTGKPAPIKMRSTDPTIVISELDKRVLSVKTVFDRAELKAIAPLAKAIQIGADLHIMIPRKLPAAGTAIELPEPSVPQVAEVAPVAPQVEAPPAAPAPAVVAPPPAAPEPKPLPRSAPSANPLTKPSMLGVLALVAIGCGVWIMKRRKQQQSPGATIDVIAQRQLGAKARIVWLAAGSREMIIAITPQNVRMLGQWKKADGPPAEMPAYTDQNLRTRLPTAQVVEPLVDRASPAVAGLLKLRARTAQPTTERDAHVLDDDVASGDVEADALWAKEILMATRANTHRGAR